MAITMVPSALRSSGICAGRSPLRSFRRSYTCAITRGIPNTFGDALSSKSDAAVTISVPKAKEEHAEYVSFMRKVLPTIHLPASDEFPDCPFVEDGAVVIGNQALITKIGAKTREGEVDAIRTALTQLGLDITDMNEECEGGIGGSNATVDGGDVLFPVTSFGIVGLQTDVGDTSNNVEAGRSPTVSKGRHLFVGISGRTNMEGTKVLEKVFGGSNSIEIVPVPIPTIEESGALHLKSIVTHIDESTLLSPKGELGDQVLAAMGAKRRGYTAIRLPDISACNVVAINGYVIATPTECVESQEVFEREMKRRNLNIKYITNIEYAKCDGAMTCRSILLDI
uniref:Dimethylargininase n=1 Tax=Odontella aurita TaxID=265563 RepID=A0A7S4ILB4_9STRA